MDESTQPSSLRSCQTAPQPTGRLTRWIAPHAEAIAQLVDEALQQEAWWTAVRNGKYAQSAVVWADRMRDEG